MRDPANKQIQPNTTPTKQQHPCGPTTAGKLMQSRKHKHKHKHKRKLKLSGHLVGPNYGRYHYLLITTQVASFRSVGRLATSFLISIRIGKGGLTTQKLL